MLPVWIPGSYMVREFARNIVTLTAASADGRRVAIEKTDKHSWQAAPVRGALTLTYQGRGSQDVGNARHWWHYNAVSLAALLRSLGFTDIRRCEFREGRLRDVAEIEHRDWSLFMEASP